MAMDNFGFLGPRVVGHSIASKSCSTVEHVNGSRIFRAKYIGMSHSVLTSNAGLHTFVFDAHLRRYVHDTCGEREGLFLGVYSQQNTHDSYICLHGRNFCHLNFGILGLISIAVNFILMTIYGILHFLDY